MRSTSLLYKILPPVHLYITSEVKQYYEALFFIIQTSDRLQYFTILQYKLHSFNIQDDRSMSGLLAKSIKTFPVTYTASRFPLLPCEMWSSVWMNTNRVTLQHNKEVIMFIFYLMVFSMCIIFKSVWYARHFEYSCKQCFTEPLKTNGTAIKITRETTNNQQKNIIRLNIFRDNNFHSQRQVLKCL